MRGGARARSGPAPDPNALRRDRDGESWTTLPAEGRKGRAPKWPLTKASKRETEIWRREWKRPQAVVWQRNGQEIEVAMYVRNLVEAEKPDAPKGKRDLVRQGQEALGISLPGLHRNRWKIAEVDDDVEPEAQPAASNVVSMLPKISARG